MKFHSRESSRRGENLFGIGFVKGYRIIDIAFPLFQVQEIGESVKLQTGYDAYDIKHFLRGAIDHFPRFKGSSTAAHQSFVNLSILIKYSAQFGPLLK